MCQCLPSRGEPSRGVRVTSTRTVPMPRDGVSRGYLRCNSSCQRGACLLQEFEHRVIHIHVASVEGHDALLASTGLGFQRLASYVGLLMKG